MAFRFLLMVLVLIPFSVSTTAHPKYDNDLSQLAIAKDLNRFINEAQKALGITNGLSVAVYTPTGMFTGAYGTTDISTLEAVTPDTAFYIASSTKSFYALALNIHDHRGDINLNHTIKRYSPKANFPEEIPSDQITLRDLLTHTSGIQNNAIVFRTAFTGVHTPELLHQLLSASEVNEKAPYGNFEYTNVGYNILSILTDQKLGTPWQDLIQQEILKPLGTTRTTAYMSFAKKEGWSIAKPHTSTHDGTSMQSLYLEKQDSTMQSAGGLIMSANDALLWLELLINDGRVKGKQIIPAKVVTDTRQRLTKVDKQFGDYLREDYGLGWYISNYQNELMIHHFGSFSGFRSHVSYLPEQKYGVAVFSNNAIVGSFFADEVANYTYDLLAGRIKPNTDPADNVKELSKQYQSILKQIKKGRESRSKRDWTLSRPLVNYVGRYKNPDLGILDISLDNGNLVARIGVLRAKAEPFTRPDSVRVELAPFNGEFIQFAFEEDEIPSQAIMPDGPFVRTD